MEGITSYEAAAALFARFVSPPKKQQQHELFLSPPPSPQTAASIAPKQAGLEQMMMSQEVTLEAVSTIKLNDKHTPGERLQRSRERNRVHARKTRQRKKEQMVTLTTRADELKEEQTRLKQRINEKNTASILVGLFATAGEKEDNEQLQQAEDDPRIEGLMKRNAEDIPDASKITELPALILPGQHNSKKVGMLVSDEASEAAFFAFATASASASGGDSKDDLPDDGIDYQLLGKDRAKCTPEELDKIRRERNRMHAKRTRDRKRLFMEEMSDMCKILEDENTLLRRHLQILDGETPDPITSETSPPPPPALVMATTTEHDGNSFKRTNVSMMDQFKTLIEVAGSLEPKHSNGCSSSNLNAMQGMRSLSHVASSVATAVSASDSNNSSATASITEAHDEEAPMAKRRKLGGMADTGLSTLGASLIVGVPHSITTSNAGVEV